MRAGRQCHDEEGNEKMREGRSREEEEERGEKQGDGEGGGSYKTSIGSVKRGGDEETEEGQWEKEEYV